jgi:hypothetical protein
MRNQVGNNGENVEAKVETYTETAAVRQNQQERKERNRKLSSAVLKLKWTKESRSHASAPKEKFQGDRLWNSCGSEAG